MGGAARTEVRMASRWGTMTWWRVRPFESNLATKAIPEMRITLEAAVPKLPIAHDAKTNSALEQELESCDKNKREETKFRTSSSLR